MVLQEVERLQDRAADAGARGRRPNGAKRKTVMSTIAS